MQLLRSGKLPTAEWRLARAKHSPDRWRLSRQRSRANCIRVSSQDVHMVDRPLTIVSIGDWNDHNIWRTEAFRRLGCRVEYVDVRRLVHRLEARLVYRYG